MRTLTLTRPPMRGPDVEAVQRRLNQKGFPCNTDGIYGPETAKQVVRAKRALHYPLWRQKPHVGQLFRTLLRTLPDVATGAELLLPETFTKTHDTAGLPNFPAIDLFATGGTTVGAPEDGELTFAHRIEWSHERRVGGWTCYFQGDSGDTYFLTHFGDLRPVARYRRQENIGTVGVIPGGWWEPHIHEGKHEGRFFPNL